MVEQKLRCHVVDCNSEALYEQDLNYHCEEHTDMDRPHYPWRTDLSPEMVIGLLASNPLVIP